MKKVTKMKLSEMAKKMPVLTPQEQREYTGGAIYYNQSGFYIGKSGSSNEIRIINYDTFISLRQCNDDSEIYGNSRPLSGSNDNVILNILNSIALEAGIQGGIKMDYWNNPKANGGITESGNIVISSQAPNFRTGNYYDFLLTLYHEKHHTETFDSGATEAENEYDAYSYVLGLPEFKLASDFYQSGAKAKEKEYREKMLKESGLT